MHPILAAKERLGLYIAAWLLLAGVLAALAAMSGTLEWSEALTLTLPMSVVYAFICLAALYVCRAFPVQQTAFTKLAAILAVAAFLSGSLWLLIIRGWVALLRQIDLMPGLESRYKDFVPVVLGVGVLLYLLAVVVHYLILAFEASRTAERVALELHAQAREAELKALKSQIQPHFLFNSLNSISALTTSDPAGARDMLLRLAEFLRKTLRLGGTSRIPLRDEIALIEDYIAIERVRFGSRLAFSKRVDEEALGCSVPSLILQPLVENAIKHGIANSVDGGAVMLEARALGNRLFLAVENPVEADSTSRTSGGVGLENVASRLASAYGNEARLDTKRTSSLFRAEMLLPAIPVESR